MRRVRTAAVTSRIAAVWLCCDGAPAFGAGGSHVVDDTGIEPAGVCYVSGWVTISEGEQLLLNASPACTFATADNVEVSASLIHVRRGRDHASELGVGSKIVLGSPFSAFDLALSAGVALDPGSGSITGASLIAPVTIPVSDNFAVSLNGGLLWSSEGNRHDAFAGAQFDAALTNNLRFMSEVFWAEGGLVGAQTGLRFIALKAGMELDIVWGRFVDGATPNSVSVGLTIK